MSFTFYAVAWVDRRQCLIYVLCKIGRKKFIARFHYTKRALKKGKEKPSLESGTIKLYVCGESVGGRVLGEIVVQSDSLNCTLVDIIMVSVMNDQQPWRGWKIY